MNMNTYERKVLSFHELMLNIQKLEIPIIQRDYVQGRKDKQEIRENFLKVLYDCIYFKKPIKLDFIYGSIVNDSFLPLDGQQRLTTLFLLHWYAASKDNCLNDEIKNLLSKFSYETRITSREFCTSLVNNEVKISTDFSDVSNLIIDANWFFLSWKKDPSIDSMLRTIDDIHKYFVNIKDLWERLTSKPNLISFNYVELEGIGLTDDLYIKMNARGKLLTPFENFKASFQKYIEDNRWEENKSPEEKFALKIDTTWTDFFWGKFKKNYTIDDAFMRFIATVVMIRQSIEHTNTKPDDRALLIKNLNDEPNSVKPENFTKADFDYLTECFEIYKFVYDKNINLKISFPMWRHESKTSILSEIVYEEHTSSTVTNSAPYSQKVLFFAQTEYLRRNKSFDESKFFNWMRVIRNIVSRGDLDKDGKRNDIVRSPQSFDGIINLVNELAEYSNDIYDNLSKLGTLKSQFAKEQIEEEKNKSKIIVTSPEYKENLFEAENNELLRGRIDFIFYCMAYDKEPKNFNIKLFNKIKDVFSIYFCSENCLNNDLRRAFLTIQVSGVYAFYCYWYSYWYLGRATKRKLFNKFRELEYYIYCEHKDYFKNLVLQLIGKDLKQIVENFQPDENFPNWKKRLIKESNLLDNKSKSNYIAITENDSSCWLLRSQRPRDMDGNFHVK